MNYQKTKIYKIMSHVGDKVYVGSTTKSTLAMRMAHHRSDYSVWKNHTAKKQNKIMSYELFDEYGVDNCFIVLLENFPCISKDEKNAKEAHWIRTVDCVNKKMPGRTRRQYYDENIEHFREKGREYSKAYFEKHKESKLSVIECECGFSFTHCNTARHLRTQRHKAYLDSKK
jgi:hypothetical protein